LSLGVVLHYEWGNKFVVRKERYDFLSEVGCYGLKTSSAFSASDIYTVFSFSCLRQWTSTYKLRILWQESSFVLVRRKFDNHMQQSYFNCIERPTKYRSWKFYDKKKYLCTSFVLILCFVGTSCADVIKSTILYSVCIPVVVLLVSTILHCCLFCYQSYHRDDSDHLLWHWQQLSSSWFQTFAVFWILYAFLWVITRRL